MKMKMDFAQRSGRGLVRRKNEDCVLCLGEMTLFAVADGMGGGSAGEVASRMVCEELKRGVVADAYLSRLDEIGRAIAAANARICAYAKEQGFKQMGTTVALLALDEADGGRGAIGYVGDSRVYRVRDGKAHLLTRDHSVGAELETKVGPDVGRKFSERSNPLAHVLTRVIGVEKCVELEWRKIDVLPDDRFLVCSDGVHDVIATDELVGLVASGTVEAAVKRLEGAVLERGAPDNYSFVLIEIGGAQ